MYLVMWRRFSYSLKSYCVTNISYMYWSCAPRSHCYTWCVLLLCDDILSIQFITTLISICQTQFLKEFINFLQFYGSLSRSTNACFKWTSLNLSIPFSLQRSSPQFPNFGRAHTLTQYSEVVKLHSTRSYKLASPIGFQIN